MKIAGKAFSILMLTAIVSMAACPSGHAEEEEAAPASKTLFVVETDEEMIHDSLHRIAGGDYDLGFADESQSYESEHHRPEDPFHS